MKTIADLMTRNVQVIGPDEPIQRAAQLMDELNVGALPVCDGDLLLGMITDRDITVRATAAGLLPTQTRVADAMSDQVHWCDEGDQASEVLQRMGESQIRRVPVLNKRMVLVGIVSLGDLATRGNADVETALRDISEPSEPVR